MSRITSKFVEIVGQAAKVRNAALRREFCRACGKVTGHEYQANGGWEYLTCSECQGITVNKIEKVGT